MVKNIHFNIDGSNPDYRCLVAVKVFCHGKVFRTELCFARSAFLVT